MAALRVGLLGAGAIARSHLRAIVALPGLELVAVAAGSIGSARALLSAERLPAELGVSEVEFWERRPDLVAIATPTGLHTELARKALEHGAHVLIEKPLDTDLDRAAALVRWHSQRTPELVCAVVSQHRFDPATERVRDAIDQGAFGRLTSATMTVPWWRSQQYYDRSDWRGTWAFDGGGALLNQGIHVLDLLVWLLGRPVRVSAHRATLAHERIEVEDTLTGWIEFESGALATVHASTAAYPGLTTRLTIMGSAGSAIIDHDRLTYCHVASGAEPAGDMGLGGGGNQVSEVSAAPEDPTVDHSGHTRQYVDLLHAIADARNPRVTAADALGTLAVAAALYRSTNTGRVTPVGELLAELRLN